MRRQLQPGPGRDAANSPIHRPRRQAPTLRADEQRPPAAATIALAVATCEPHLKRGPARPVLAPELARIPDALVIPLGVSVDAAIALLVGEGKIDSARCLVGFPHPSGRNRSGAAQWEANRSKLKRRVSAWFRSTATA